MANHHILLVTFPAQGHINPSLQFTKRLTKHGVRITLFTSKYAISRMNKASSINSLIDFISFSDDYDNGWDTVQANDFMSSLRTHGSKAMEELIVEKQKTLQPFTRVIYTLLVPWAGQVAHRLQVPVTLLWIQPAVLFGVYYYFYNKYFDKLERDTTHIQLPGLPLFELNDLPSFLLPSNPSIYDFALPTFIENFEILDKESHPTVLMNTFDALEVEPLKVIDKYKLRAIGPFIPSAFLDGNDPSDTSFGGDLIQKSVDYVEWLNTNEKSSVVYVAFGSYSELSKPQMVEIEKGLIESKKPFLWVIRGGEKSEKLDEILTCREDLEKLGKIVPWCTQVEVLSHGSVGCFVTHCGWNSTLESLASGVPVVGFPQWTDQSTNAKLVEDYWKTGLRLRKGEDGVVKSDEISRCLDIVMGGGERGEEMRKEAQKWSDLAKEAMKEDGSSNVNLKTFVDEIIR